MRNRSFQIPHRIFESNISANVKFERKKELGSLGYLDAQWRLVSLLLFSFQIWE